MFSVCLKNVLFVFSLGMSMISIANASVCFLPDPKQCTDGEAVQGQGCDSSYNYANVLGNGAICSMCNDRNSDYYGQYKCSCVEGMTLDGGICICNDVDKEWSDEAQGCICSGGRESCSSGCCCPGGKKWNSLKSVCECAAPAVEDSNGNCVTCNSSEHKTWSSSEGKCVCTTGFKEVGGSCVCEIPGTSWSAREGKCVCSDSKKEIVSGRCVCKSEYVQDTDGRCITQPTCKQIDPTYKTQSQCQKDEEFIANGESGADGACGSCVPADGYVVDVTVVCEDCKGNIKQCPTKNPILSANVSVHDIEYDVMMKSREFDNIKGTKFSIVVPKIKNGDKDGFFWRAEFFPRYGLYSVWEGQNEFYSNKIYSPNSIEGEYKWYSVKSDAYHVEPRKTISPITIRLRDEDDKCGDKIYFDEYGVYYVQNCHNPIMGKDVDDRSWMETSNSGKIYPFSVYDQSTGAGVGAPAEYMYDKECINTDIKMKVNGRLKSGSNKCSLVEYYDPTGNGEIEQILHGKFVSTDRGNVNVKDIIGRDLKPGEELISCYVDTDEGKADAWQIKMATNKSVKSIINPETYAGGASSASNEYTFEPVDGKLSYSKKTEELYISDIYSFRIWSVKKDGNRFAKVLYDSKKPNVAYEAYPVIRVAAREYERNINSNTRKYGKYKGDEVGTVEVRPEQDKKIVFIGANRNILSRMEFNDPVAISLEGNGINDVNYTRLMNKYWDTYIEHPHFAPEAVSNGIKSQYKIKTPIVLKVGDVMNYVTKPYGDEFGSNIGYDWNDDLGEGITGVYYGYLGADGKITKNPTFRIPQGFVNGAINEDGAVYLFGEGFISRNGGNSIFQSGSGGGGYNVEMGGAYNPDTGEYLDPKR